MMEVTDQNFSEEIKKSTKPMLVDFFAEWCVPCSALSPVIERVAKNFESQIDFLKINLDSIPLTAQKFGIDRIPTVILFKEGLPISGFLGVQPEAVITDWLKNILKDGNDDFARLKKECESYAKKNGFRLNPDKDVTDRLLIGLLENENKYGLRYCPCRRITGIPEEDKSKICPCDFHKEEIEKNGHCLCGLYLK
ncbi:MAG: thioredoxin [Candidatus Nealsonbacteria bacterium]